MDQETENEAIDIESIDESACSASSLLEGTSQSTSSWQGTVNHIDDYNIPDDIDAKSKMLIKQMLEEERRYMFGRRKEKYPQKEAVKLPTKGKERKVTHNKRWTEEERKVFYDAKMQYGHRWSKIAEIMGTRTPQQVKTFYRYSVQKEQAESAALRYKGEKASERDIKDTGLKSRLAEHQQHHVSPQKRHLSPQKHHLSTQKHNSGEQINIKSGTESDEDEEVDILNDSGEESLPERLDLPSEKQSEHGLENVGGYSLIINNNNEKNTGIIMGKSESISDRNVNLRVKNEKREDCARILEPETLMKTDQLSCSIHKQTAIGLNNGRDTLQSTDNQSRGSDEPMDGLGVSQTSSLQSASKSLESEKEDFIGKKIPRLKLSCASIVKPRKEAMLDRNTVTEEEKLKFCSNPTKSEVCDPERYLFIRNTLLDKWNEQKPKCLTKTIAKNVFRSCDINLMESIRDYLDQIGAINFTPQDDLPEDFSSVTEEEKELHPDFFLPFDKPRHRTPEKYIKIRNFFIDAWEANKPKYVPKTSIRGAFKNCGDVNTIASIHETLESLGLINVGVVNPYSDATKKRRENQKKKKEAIQSNSGVSEGENVRRSQRSRQRPEREEKLPGPKRPKRGPRPKYDPFKLLECFQFSESNPAPFSVSAEADAVALMDLHAHLSSTEVIGLLGGCFQESHNTLSIIVAKPCKSLSTGMQCEMDPVSQTVAYESIMSSGHQVVGWYHSHPAFLPNPSVRDIETQSEFQGWFSQGGAPFVGMIVSPYQRIKDNVSMINCLIVRQTETPTGMEDRPFQFEFCTDSENADPLQLLKSAQELMEMFEGYSLRVKMDALYTSKCSYMEKTIFSVCSHYNNDSHKEIIREKLENILLVPDKPEECEKSLHSEEDTTGNDHG